MWSDELHVCMQYGVGRDPRPARGPELHARTELLLLHYRGAACHGRACHACHAMRSDNGEQGRRVGVQGEGEGRQSLLRCAHPQWPWPKQKATPSCCCHLSRACWGLLFSPLGHNSMGRCAVAGDSPTPKKVWGARQGATDSAPDALPMSSSGCRGVGQRGVAALAWMSPRRVGCGRCAFGAMGAGE